MKRKIVDEFLTSYNLLCTEAKQIAGKVLREDLDKFYKEPVVKTSIQADGILVKFIQRAHASCCGDDIESHLVSWEDLSDE